MKLSYVQFLVTDKICRNCKCFIPNEIDVTSPTTIIDYGGRCTYMQSTTDMLGYCGGFCKLLEYKKL